MPTTTDDTQLLLRIASGSQDALAEFYRLFESQVYAFALSRLNDPHACADIVNEVMLAVWKGAERYQGNAKVRTWLLGITHHKVVDRLRKKNRYDYEELDSEIPDGTTPSATSVIEQSQDADKVRECVDKLSDAHKQVVHLVFFEDLSYGEIAETVGCPEGTVKTRVFHAKQLLKRCLGKELGEI